MKQGWSCPSWHRSREQTQAGGRVGSSAKPSRGGRTCYRCLGWCGMWAEGSAHCTRVLLSFYSTEVICSSLWPDLIRRVGFLSSVFFFFFFLFLWSIEFTIAQISKSLARFQHLSVDSVSSGHSLHVCLGLCLKRQLQGQSLEPERP